VAENKKILTTRKEEDNINRVQMRRRNSAFTLIEIMITITLMAITFFPLMSLFTSAIESINMTSEMSTSLNLAREGMEMVRNLNLSAKRLEELGTYLYPEKDKDPLFINKKTWRIRTVIHKGTTPLKVDVEVLEDPYDHPVITLSTLFEDLY